MDNDSLNFGNRSFGHILLVNACAYLSLSVSASAENHLRGSETGPCDRAPRVLSRSCASR